MFNMGNGVEIADLFPAGTVAIRQRTINYTLEMKNNVQIIFFQISKV